MARTLKMTFATDRNMGGTAVNVLIDGDFYDTDGWDEEVDSFLVDEWYTALQRLARFPRVLKDAGLTWADGDVKPFGYSQGLGHTQEGIVVTFEIPDHAEGLDDNAEVAP